LIAVAAITSAISASMARHTAGRASQRDRAAAP
jgi:hypothetical protein